MLNGVEVVVGVVVVVITAAVVVGEVAPPKIEGTLVGGVAIENNG